MEEEPRIIELRGDAAQKINRAYGTTGIITALEMPLAPAWQWIDVVVAFDDFMDAVAFGHEVALADGIVKKLLSADRLRRCRAISARCEPHCPEGKSVLIAMIAEPSLESFSALLGGRGTITLETPTDEAPGQGAALRIHLEPHDPAGAEGRPQRHLSAMPLSRTTGCSNRWREMRATVRRRGAAASRIHPLRRPRHLRARCRSCATRPRSG